MSAPGDNLPRPPMPLEPWRVAQIECARCGTVDMPDWLAALPEWVAARDAEREGRLRAEARVRALEEALGEALEALHEPAAEKALAALREIRGSIAFDANPPYPLRGIAAVDSRRTMAEALLRILARHGFGGGS